MNIIKLDVLAMAAHPDDVELSCGATIAKLSAAKKNVGILDFTKGELGTRGTAEIRQKEATKAAKILDVQYREQLDLPDGFFEVNQENLLQLIRVIRQYKPNVVLCNAPQDRHPDHSRAAELATRACFLSGLRKIYTGQEAWRPKKVFHYIQWDGLQPDFIVDVSGFLNAKMQSCLAYESQFYQENSSEPHTPISSKNFLDSIEYRARDLGRYIGTEAGEGFILPESSYLGVQDFDCFL